MTPRGPQDTTSSSVQKHRACDECRSRKLACSKEPSGCSRCRREGIPCHYSPQKPMGRPRKRRLVEDPASVEEEAPAVENVVVSSSEAASGQTGDQEPPFMEFPDGSSLNFLDEPGSSNLEFMDLLPYGYQDNAQIDPQILSASNGTVEEGFPLSLNGVDLLSGINFDEDLDSSAVNMSKDISDSLHRYWQAQDPKPVEAPESTSSDLSNSTSSPESFPGQTSASSSCSSADPALAPTPKAIPSVACGCLSSLYLALDSLSRLPTDVMGAIRVARHATKVAHDVIRCSVCSDSLTDDPTMPPPIQAFQNLMCLAALVPSACNAYASILELVDTETANAKRERRTIWFSFKDIGGIWGVVSPKHHDDDCPRMAAFNNRNMEPDTWRTTMRAILRLDVYGFGEPPDDVPSNSFRQSGLRDVVKLLEERSAKRHDRMDHLYATGLMPQGPGYVLLQSYKPVPPDQRNCMRVLEAARIALDNLVIA